MVGAVGRACEAVRAAGLVRTELDAWWDTVDTGAISGVIDKHRKVVVRVAPRGMFAPGNRDSAAFAEVTNESAYASLEVRPAPQS